MELKDFVKETLVQISQGIEEANQALESSAAMVNPLHITGHSETAQTYGRTKSPSSNNRGTRTVQPISFDVAVVAESGERGEAGAKLSIASIGIGGGASTESTNRSESRIKFVIPMVYPGYDNNC